MITLRGFVMTLHAVSSVAYLVSAFAKAITPASVTWVAMALGLQDKAAGMIVVALSCALQAAVSGAALLYWMRVWTIWTSLGMSCCIALLHLASGPLGVSSCGCFGNWSSLNSVAPVFVWAGLVSQCVIVSAGWARHVSAARKPIASLATMVIAPVAVGFLANAPIWMGTKHYPGAQGPDIATQIILAVDVPANTNKALIVIGSWGCQHCVDAINGMGYGERDNAPSIIYLVTSDEDSATRPRGLSRVREVRVPSSLWWSAIPTTPPGIIEFVRGGEVTNWLEWYQKHQSTLIRVVSKGVDLLDFPSFCGAVDHAL